MINKDNLDGYNKECFEAGEISAKLKIINDANSYLLNSAFKDEIAALRFLRELEKTEK